MAQILTAKIRLRQGKDVDRRGIILDTGEISFTTDYDSQRIFIGDGFTLGGLAAGMKLYIGSLGPQYKDGLRSFATIQRNDITYDTFSTGLYAMTSTDPESWSDTLWFSNIGPTVSDTSISYNQYGRISIKTWGVSALHIDNAMDTNGGILKINPIAPYRVNIDSVSLKLNNEFQIYADPTSINWSLLPTAYNSSFPDRLWVDINDGGILKIGTA
jgi:hypothetical protein